MFKYLIKNVNNEQVYAFPYTGVNQSFTVPTNAKFVEIECWGAGGANQGGGSMVMYNTGCGGGGGYIKGKFTKLAGEILNVIVGGGGVSSNNGVDAPATYGGGGSQNLNGDGHWGSASGGGRSAVQLSTASQDIITAGGGGGGGGNSCSGASQYYGLGAGGPGGGTVGGDAANVPELGTYAGLGGTQSVGGNNGTTVTGNTETANNASQYIGGGGNQYGAGAGSGYYGGGYGGIVSFDGSVPINTSTASTEPLSTGLVLWLDSSNTDSLVLSGSNVTQWNDLSTSGSNAVPFVGTSTYSDNCFNGSFPGVTMNATSMYSPLPVGTFNDGITAFVVFVNVGLQSNNALISRTSTNNPSLAGPIDMYNSSRFVGDSSTTGTSPNTVGTPVGTPVNFNAPLAGSLYNVSVSATTGWSESLNGVNVFSNTGYEAYYQDAGDYFYIGSRGDQYTTMNGVISEVLVYNSVLSESDQLSVQSYLANKWAIDIYSSTSVTSGSSYWIFGGGAGGSSFVDTTDGILVSMDQADGSNVGGLKYLPTGVSNVGGGAPETDILDGGTSGQNGYVVISVSH